MPFALQYKPLIESESSTSKTLIRPRNIYKINNYKYKDGITKSLAGFETSLVFIIGISPEKVVSCLKITLIKPDLFFKWLKKLVRAGLSEEEMKNTDINFEIREKSRSTFLYTLASLRCTL